MVLKTKHTLSRRRFGIMQGRMTQAAIIIRGAMERYRVWQRLPNRVAYQRRHWISFTCDRARSTVAAYALTWASVLRRRTRQMNAVCGLCLRLGAWRPCSAKADKSSNDSGQV